MLSSGSITPLPLDLELLGELAEKLPSEVIEQLTNTWRKQSESLARSEKENRLLRLMRVEKYGPAGERLIDEQLELLEQEPGVSEAEVKAESERAQLQSPLKGPKQRPARQSLPAELPRIEQLIASSAQECVCVAPAAERRWSSVTRPLSNSACRSDQEDPQTETEKLYQASSSLVVTSNPSRMFRPKTIVIGTSPASRPRPITTRPIRR